MHKVLRGICKKSTTFLLYSVRFSGCLAPTHGRPHYLLAIQFLRPIRKSLTLKNRASSHLDNSDTSPRAESSVQEDSLNVHLHYSFL